jgi:hypothetical protein
MKAYTSTFASHRGVRNWWTWRQWRGLNTKICSPPPPPYVRLRYTVQVVGTTAANVLAKRIMCTGLLFVSLSPLSLSFLCPFSAYSVHELEKRHNAVGILRVRVESMDESTWLGRKTATRGSREPMEGREGKGRRGKAPPPSSVCRAWLWLWTLSPGAVCGRRFGGSDGG